MAQYRECPSKLIYVSPSQQIQCLYTSKTALRNPSRSGNNIQKNPKGYKLAKRRTGASSVQQQMLLLRPHSLLASSLCHHSPPITSARSHSFPPILRQSKPVTIRCMANQRRVNMVARQIQREISDMLITDKVLRFAVQPEASLGADKYLTSVTSISDVEVSSDLQVVKVYVSIFGDERGKEVAMAGLKSKAKYVRSMLGKRMKLRLTPEVRFIEDESIERGNRVIAILDKIKAKKEAAQSQSDEHALSSDSPQDNGDWEEEGEEEEEEEDDDPDQDIIYVK